jgi:hypothetical protein
LLSASLMTQLGNLWTIVLGVAGLLVMFAVIGYLVARVMRSRNANGSASGFEGQMSALDADYLDSSHIGLEPFAGGENLPRYDANTPVRKGYAKQPPR